MPFAIGGNQVKSGCADDDESIANLSKTTSHCFDTDKVRLLYVRAQVSRIDLKIDLALCEVNRRYKRLVRDAAGSAFAPMGATITQKVSTTAITKKIINCFGLPTVSAEKALAALTSNVWRALGHKVMMAISEGFHIFGILASAPVMGAPTYLISGSINAYYVVSQPLSIKGWHLRTCSAVLISISRCLLFVPYS